MDIESTRTTLTYEDEPTRRIGVRVERPRGESGSLPFVVLVHGFKGFMDWGFFPRLSVALVRAGNVVVSMNASGSGIGDDPMEMTDDEAFLRDTFGRQLQDIDRVRRFAADLEGVQAGAETLLGHSRGGGMVILAGAERAPRRIVTWAAIDNVDRVDEVSKAAWRRDGFLPVPNGRTGQIHRMGLDLLEEAESEPARFDILRAASRLRVPLLALHGSADGTVEPAAAERIARATPRGRALILDGADHGFGTSHPLAVDASVPHLDAAIEGTTEFLRSTD